jgi:hypothetical protein
MTIHTQITIQVFVSPRAFGSRVLLNASHSLNQTA